MERKTTAERLKEVMCEKGLRQRDVLDLCEPFCKKYGVRLNKNDLSQYVNGKVIPRQDKLVVLGNALNVSETWLMGFDVTKERECYKAPLLVKEDSVQYRTEKETNKTTEIELVRKIVNSNLTSEQLEEINRFIEFVICK